MFDDDKGRGSYKCGRCGVPKKGHVCPYQPKVKRRPEDPPPEMKCVSTQVEMDEFMTLRRLNLEIQGFPESYAAEPIDMVGAEVHHHPPQVLVSSGMNGVPPYSASASNPISRGPVEQGHPGGVPSLASMNSHPHPSSYPPVQDAPYSHPSSMPLPESTPESKPANPNTKSEQSPAPEKAETDLKPAAAKTEAVEITSQTETVENKSAAKEEGEEKAAASTETAAAETAAESTDQPLVKEETKTIENKEEVTTNTKVKEEATSNTAVKEEVVETNNEAGEDSNKRIKL